MKSEYKAAAGIFALVLLGGAISAAVFVWVGSEIAVYSLIGMVPFLALIGFLFVRTTLSGGGDGQSQIREQQARKVGRMFATEYGRLQSMRDAYPELADDLDISFEQIVADLEAEGIDVNREAGTASLSRFASPDITTLSSIQEDIEATARRRDEAFISAIRDAIADANSQLQRLDGLIDVDVRMMPEDVDRETAEETDRQWWRTLGRALEAHREHTHEEIERAVETVRRAMRDAEDVDEAAVEEHLSAAESTTNVATAVEETLAARDEFRAEASKSFGERRRELLALVDSVETADVEKYVGADEYDDFTAVAAAVRELDDAMQVEELSSRGHDLQSACTALVASLERQLNEQIATLKGANVPDDYYDRPEAADVDYTAELRETIATDEYRRTWEAAATALTSAVDRLETKARVAEVYDDVADVIDEQLRTTGRVAPEDLPIKRDHDQFMGLYARTHDVEFDSSIPSLTAASGAETHEVTVTVSFPEGGIERTATVELEGTDYAASESVTTYLAEEVTFEDVPYGEYEIRAIPAPENNETATATVTVDADVVLDLEMADVSLRERLCADLEDVDELLDPLRDRLANRFEEEGYLTSSMVFPVDEEYVACLLATWGWETGHEVTETDGDVLVYDADGIVDDLQKVARHNLDVGEEMDTETLRERFLSVPVPDTAIKDAARRIERIEPTATGIIKTDD